jgi:hypothetical protein
MVDRGLATAGPRPSPGLAHLTDAKAKALSLLGRHAEARRTLNSLTEISGSFSNLDFWRPDQHYFAESFVYGAAGDEAAAGRARETVLRLNQDNPAPSWNYLTNVQLHQATCIIVNGGTGEGAAQAVTVLDQVPDRFRTNEITQTARLVLNAVPQSDHRQPAIEDLRHAIAAH